jgi:IS5 family transposase
MRIKFDPQAPLHFGSSHLKVTQQYYHRYTVINQILLAVPEILTAFHEDAARPLEKACRNRQARFSSDQLLRAILVMEIEQLSYRDTTIRIDDSEFLRRFVGVHQGPVMDYSTLAKVYKAIRPETWKSINEKLGAYALERNYIQGESLRVDTTVYETNVHHPTDSSLLWDGYRVLARCVSALRELDPQVVGEGRLQTTRVKKLALRITLMARRTLSRRRQIDRPYRALLAQVRGLLAWSQQARQRADGRLVKGAYDPWTQPVVRALLLRMRDFESLTARVVDQAERRVLRGESVPNAEKILSLFEPHTELLIRGKAGKPIEFGHKLLLQQVENQFISDYQVFAKQPSDESLVDGILENHQRLFGRLPEHFTTDKGFYRSMEKLRELETRIPHVAIAKKGARTVEEIEREHDRVFKALQRFRAGIEGSISFLKRCFKLGRCFYRSFKTYCSSVGSHIFAHNLVVLARL